MPQSAKEWWVTYVETLQIENGHIPPDSDCPLHQLRIDHQRPAAEDNGSTDVPEQLVQLREKEMEPLEEVHIF